MVRGQHLRSLHRAPSLCAQSLLFPHLSVTASPGAPHILLGLRVTLWPCLAPSPGCALVQGRDPGSQLGSVRVRPSPFLLPKEVVPLHAVDLGTP